MKQVVIVALLWQMVWASSLHTLVQQLLPGSVYAANRSVVGALFANGAAYRHNGRYDYQKIFAALESVGVMQEALGNGKEVVLRFHGATKPYLFFFLCDGALERGNVYRSMVLETAYASDALERSFRITTHPALSFSKMVAYLQANGAVVRDVRYARGGWEFWLDMSMAALRVGRPEGGEITPDGDALWLDVTGASQVVIYALGKYWHPQIAIYDEELAPLDLYQAYEPTKRLRLSLPNGSRYIKIADIFSSKNIKHGFRVTLIK